MTPLNEEKSLMNEKQNFDIAVIGAGPGGYVAAIKAAQMGKKVALIEKQYLGGTCLNVGCIPTKTLLANTSVLKKIKEAKDFGIIVGDLTFDFSKMKERKDRVVQGIQKSLEGLIQQNKITIIRGTAKFVSPKELKILGEQNMMIEAPSIIIATGSEPFDVPAFPCDHKLIRNSTSILELTELPKHLIIIGGGYIGCEFASLYAEMGVQVTILEALDSIIPTQPKAVVNALTKAFQGQGITMKTNVFVEKIETTETQAKVHLAGGDTVDADMVLVAVGRSCNTKGLDLDKAGLSTSDKGVIETNERMETSVPGIYAIGDITGKWMLAHVASHQGMVAAANAAGQEAKIHYNAVPAVIFTTPEIATVGMSLEEATKAGIDATIGSYPFQALGKSQATRETTGFAQIVTDKKTGEVIGAQVVGNEASALIGEMTLAIANELTLDCVIDTIHAHPTVAEVWLEAALLANETPIHFPPKRK